MSPPRCPAEHPASSRCKTGIQTKQKKHLPGWPHALAKTKGGRQTTPAAPRLRSQLPQSSSDSSAHRMHVLFCGAETEGGPP